MRRYVVGIIMMRFMFHCQLEVQAWLRDIGQSLAKIARSAPRTMGLLWRQSVSLTVTYALTVMYLTGGPILLAYSLGILVDQIVAGSSGAGMLDWLALVVLSQIVLIPAVGRCQSYLAEKVDYFLWFEVQAYASEALGHLDVSYHLDPKMADRNIRVKEKAQWRVSKFADNQLLFILNMFGVMFAAWMLRDLGWWPLLIIVACLPELIVELSFSRSERKLDLEMGETWRKFWRTRSYLQEVQHVIEVFLMRLTDFFGVELRGHAGLTRDKMTALACRFLWWRLAFLVVSHTAILAAAWMLIGEAREGRVLPGELTFLIGTLVSYGAALTRFAVNLRDLCKDTHLVTEFWELVDLSKTGPPAKECGNPGAEDAGSLVCCPATATDVFVRDLSYTHVHSDTPALDGICMDFKAGSKVAVVGVSGSGKSTEQDLLSGLLQPEKGSIRIGGVMLDRIERDSRLKHWGVLKQDFSKYTPYTFRTLLAMGADGSVDEKRLRAAAIAAQAMPVIEKHGGLDRLVGKDFDHGIDLSHGEWQRLRLAGLLYRDPWLLLLDEPTSALDPEFEDPIIKHLMDLKDRTVILVTHRLVNCIKADWIYVLGEGKVIEQGTHADLLKLKGWYAGAYSKQTNNQSSED